MRNVWWVAESWNFSRLEVLFGPLCDFLFRLSAWFFLWFGFESLMCKYCDVVNNCDLLFVVLLLDSCGLMCWQSDNRGCEEMCQFNLSRQRENKGSHPFLSRENLTPWWRSDWLASPTMMISSFHRTSRFCFWTHRKNKEFSISWHSHKRYLCHTGALEPRYTWSIDSIGNKQHFISPTKFWFFKRGCPRAGNWMVTKYRRIT